TGDERGSSGRAALLAIAVGKAHPFLRDAVDIGCAVAHQPVTVATQVGDADIVAPDHDDVRLVCSSSRSSHLDLLSLVGWCRKCLLVSVSQNAALRGARGRRRNPVARRRMADEIASLALAMTNLLDLND